MPESQIHLNQSGSSQKSRAIPAKTILASGKARENYARVVVAGILLVILGIAYVVALFTHTEGTQGILAVIGSSIGFLLGREGRKMHDDL